MKLLFIFLTIAATISQAFAVPAGDHFWTTDPTGESAGEEGYTLEGAAAWVPNQFVNNTVPVFRWFNPTTGAHFWTSDPSGEDAPETGYVEEGLAYSVFDVTKIAPVGAVPWFRFGQSNDNNFYSTSFSEGLNEGPFELVVGYVYSVAVEDTEALYRWTHA